MAAVRYIRPKSPNLGVRRANKTGVRDRIPKSFAVEMAVLDFADARSLATKPAQMPLVL